MRYDNETKIKDLYIHCIHTYFTEYTLSTPAFQPTSKFNKLAWIDCTAASQPVIYMSSIFDLEDKMALNIMAHEIIHYILFSKGDKKWNKHDEAFLKIANQLNQRYGLNVSSSKDVLPNRQSHGEIGVPISKFLSKVKKMFI